MGEEEDDVEVVGDVFDDEVPFFCLLVGAGVLVFVTSSMRGMEFCGS